MYGPVFKSYEEVMATVPLTEAKTKLNELVEQAVATHERVTIARRGRPAVVLISVDDLESMEETLHWQAQPGGPTYTGHDEGTTGSVTRLIRRSAYDRRAPRWPPAGPRRADLRARRPGGSDARTDGPTELSRADPCALHP